MRKPADPSARLALLLAGRKAIKPGDRLNMADLANALGMTARNLKLTINADENFPVVSRGGEGVAWVFDAGAVFDHLISKCEAAIAERSNRSDRINRLSGLMGDKPAPTLAGASGDLTPGELKQLGESMMTAHKLKMARRELMPKAEALAFFVDLMSQMQSDTLGLLGKIDPAGQLPAETRLAVEDGMRTLLVNLQDRTAKFIEKHRAAAA
jgi:hypothetical protein